VGGESPVRFATETEAVDTAIPLRLVAHSVEAVEPRGRRLNLTLDEQEGGFRIFLALELYDNHPVLRYTVRVKNLLGTERRVRMADLLYWNFADRGARYRTFQVYQWNVLPPLKNFQPVESELVPGGAAVEVRAGSAGDHCGWLALRDASGAGLSATGRRRRRSR
jgi:hypothetical protein